MCRLWNECHWGKVQHENCFLASKGVILTRTVLHVQENLLTLIKIILNTLIYDDLRQSTQDLASMLDCDRSTQHLHSMGNVTASSLFNLSITSTNLSKIVASVQKGAVTLASRTEKNGPNIKSTPRAKAGTYPLVVHLVKQRRHRLL